jgi:hypothetical protein
MRYGRLLGVTGAGLWKPGGQYETRFVVAKEGKTPAYRDSFGSLALEMEKDHHAATMRGAEKGSKTLASVMAALGFAIGLGLLVYVVVNNAGTTGETLALIASLLGSAGAYYYGVWKAPS